MGIRLKPGLKNQKLAMINPYAPYMEYRNDDINTYCATLHRYIDANLKEAI